MIALPAEYGISQAFHDRLQEIRLQREEVLVAFVAKYGFEPERFVQIHKRYLDGSDAWYVHRRSDEEMLELSKSSAML